MIYQTIKLKDINKNITTDATLDVYVPIPTTNGIEFSIHKPLLIIPGGGYEFVADNEGEPTAMAFAAKGFATFVLKYSVGFYHDEYLAIKEAFAAIVFIKENASRFNLDASNFSVLGYSAGGHLSATLGMMHKDEMVAKLIEKDLSTLNINNLILCYPVITMEKNLTHEGTMLRRTLEKPELIEKYSIEKHVDSNYPRTFIWATANDELVPVNNSIKMAESLSKHRVPFELHVFPDGPHGLSIIVDKKYNYCKSWIDSAIKFITGEY